MRPFASTTFPTAFSTTSALTTTSPARTAHVPTPPFMAPPGPSALPTVAPVPAPTDPSGISVEAALHARYASSPVGQRSAFEPGPRSKSDGWPTRDDPY